jgi:Zn-dependent oligopeptidase
MRHEVSVTQTSWPRLALEMSSIKNCVHTTSAMKSVGENISAAARDQVGKRAGGAGRSLREEVYRAYISKASSGDIDNGPVIEQIMALRQEQARLAGYSNAAEFLMANKVRPWLPAACCQAAGIMQQHCLPCTQA